MAAEFNPVEIVDGDYSCGLILLCDHARNCMPDEYGALGIDEAQLLRHIAYDIGARNVTVGLARKLGIPAVLTTYSRLLVDPNRGEDDPTVVMKIADGAVIPGNHPIAPSEMERRLRHYYRPYHEAIDRAIDRTFRAGIVPALFSIHSFTKSWRGRARPWQAALLWDRDPRFTHALLGELRAIRDLAIGDNEPYDGALKNDTLYQHGTARGLAHALIEIRQDLIGEARGVVEWVELLAPMLKRVNGLAQLHEISHFGSRTGAVASRKNPAVAAAGSKQGG